MRRCLNCMNEYLEDCQDICPHCGYVDGKTLDGAVYLMPGSILQGRYIVGTVITARDADVTYHGWDALFDRKVQIQEYFPKYCATREGKPEVSIYDAKQERYEEGLELFCRQSRELIRLYKESDIATYHACFVENKTAYAIMDNRSDQTLEEKLNGRTMKVREALSLLSQVIESVDKCHRIGVYHGLVSAETFWLTGDGKLILKGFGAWRYYSGEPGIVDYGKAGIHTDVYRITQLFCRMVTGREIEAGEKLETELLKRQISLNGAALSALKHALSHDTKSLQQFRQELYGKGERRSTNISNRLKQQRRNAKDPLAVPRWGVWGAAITAMIILVFTVLLSTGAIQMKIQSEEGRRVPGRMPNLLTYDVEAAMDELNKMGMDLILVSDKMEFDNEVPEGRICYQSPKEASIIKPGDAVTIYISKGKEKKRLPSLWGITKEEALTKLRETGFHHVLTVNDEKADGAYGTVVRIEMQEQPEEDGETDGIVGKIINFTVKALDGKQKKEIRLQDDEDGLWPLDTEITLVICMKENAVSATEDILVPAVTGMEKSGAENVLGQLGLHINWIEEVSDTPAGTVLGQTPEAGENVADGAYVTIRISKGVEKIYMRNVKLMTEEEAKSEIENLGLVMGNVKKQYSDTIAAGKVISQSIMQDEEVKKGDAVNLVISLGTKPEKTTKAPETKKGSEGTQQTKAAGGSKRQSEAAEEARRQSEAAEEARRQSEAAEEARRQSEAAEEARRQSEAAEEVWWQTETAGEAWRQSETVEEVWWQSEAAAAERMPEETNPVLQGTSGESETNPQQSKPAGMVEVGKAPTEATQAPTEATQAPTGSND